MNLFPKKVEYPFKTLKWQKIDTPKRQINEDKFIDYDQKLIPK